MWPKENKVEFELKRPTAKRWIVAIPAKNEAERLNDSIVALDQAAIQANVEMCIMVLANDCEDESVEIARQASKSAVQADVSVHACQMPAHLAHAGGARRHAVELAFQAFGERPLDVIISTDADARFRPDAIVKMRSAFESGADVVLAKFEVISDPFDPAPVGALHWDRRFTSWRSRVRQLVEAFRTGQMPSAALHDDYGGAGIAAQIQAYRSLGGFKPLPSGEDHSFVKAADLAGLSVNRQSGAIVDVLARAHGRASGGMAQELAKCATAAVLGLPCMVECHQATARRIRCNPCHSVAFPDRISEWETAEEATLGLERVILELVTGQTAHSSAA